MTTPETPGPAPGTVTAVAQAGHPWAGIAQAVARGWGPYILVTIALLTLRWPALTTRILSIDEPSYLVQTARVDTLETFAYAFSYRLEPKTQIGLIPYLLANAIDPHNAIWITHLFGLVPALIVGYLLVALARRFYGSALPGVGAALIWGLFALVGPAYSPDSAYSYDYFQTPRLEYYQAPLILLSVYSFLWVSEQAGTQLRRAWWALGGAGAWWALSVLVKPGAILLGLFYLLALPVVWLPSEPLRSRLPALLRAAGAFLVGGVLPAGLLFAPYLFNLPALAEVKYNLLDVGGDYGQGLEILFRMMTLLLGLPPLLLAAALLLPALVAWRRWDRGAPPSSWQLRLILLAAPATLAGYLVGRGLPHYLIPVVPLVALAVMGYLLLAWRGLVAAGRPGLARALGLGLAALYLGVQVPALVSVVRGAEVDTYFAQARRHFDLDGLVAYIDTHTRPSDPIWVYYNAPELYTLTGRRPMTRDPVGAWLALLWDDNIFERMAQDLAVDQPVLIIGITDPPAREPGAGPLTTIPHVGDWIKHTYQCDPLAVRGAIICTRTGQTTSLSDER